MKDWGKGFCLDTPVMPMITGNDVNNFRNNVNLNSRIYTENIFYNFLSRSFLKDHTEIKNIYLLFDPVILEDVLTHLEGRGIKYQNVLTNAQFDSPILVKLEALEVAFKLRDHINNNSVIIHTSLTEDRLISLIKKMTYIDLDKMHKKSMFRFADARFSSIVANFLFHYDEVYNVIATFDDFTFKYKKINNIKFDIQEAYGLWEKNYFIASIWEIFHNNKMDITKYQHSEVIRMMDKLCASYREDTNWGFIPWLVFFKFYFKENFNIVEDMLFSKDLKNDDVEYLKELSLSMMEVYYEQL